MPDEAKTAQSSNQKSAQSDRPKQNRGNYKGRNNRSNNQPNNRQNNRQQNRPQRQLNQFETEAAHHSEKASYWRKRVNGFAGFTLVYAAVSLSMVTVAGGAQLIAGMGLIAFTLVFLVVHAAGNYRHHKANAALNKYRHNLLMTAEDMAKSTKDPVTKEELMLEALAAIGAGEKD